MKFLANLSASKKLFGETGGFILEVPREKMKELRELFAAQQVPMFAIGETSKEPRLRMNGVIDLAVSEAKHAWENGLRERLL